MSEQTQTIRYKLGKDAVTYCGPAGSTPTTEIEEISNETLECNVEKIEATSRRIAKTGFKGYVPGLIDVEASFDLLCTEGSAIYKTIRDSFTTQAPNAWKFVDSTGSDAYGVEFDGYVFKMSEPKEVNGLLKTSVTVAPSVVSSARLPQFIGPQVGA